jgi:hypothetical protein
MKRILFGGAVERCSFPAFFPFFVVVTSTGFFFFFIVVMFFFGLCQYCKKFKHKKLWMWIIQYKNLSTKVPFAFAITSESSRAN